MPFSLSTNHKTVIIVSARRGFQAVFHVWRSVCTKTLLFTDKDSENVKENKFAPIAALVGGNGANWAWEYGK